MKASRNTCLVFVHFTKQVVFDATFKSLINLANDGSMQVKLYMNFYWNDSYRRWNPEKIPVQKVRLYVSCVLSYYK